MPWWSDQDYVRTAERRARATLAARELAARDGIRLAPVLIPGRTMAVTFWGKAWCENLESYSDFENRLPRGRSYARNGSVLDLKVEPGKIIAVVCGSDLYQVAIAVKPLPTARWKAVKSSCRGQIGSLVELLKARLSQKVMEIVTHPDRGLFPTPHELQMDCTCPDRAEMCKHVAAVLYGVGNRLDEQPELLFKLRQVDHLELIADIAVPLKKSTRKRTIADKDLSDVFGIKLETSPETVKPARRVRPLPRGVKKL